MTYTQGVVLGLVQGLTEFLPVSSSGHLILVPHVFGWQDQGLGFDAVMHLGTLAALLAYFRRELIGMATGALSRRLAVLLILATIPGGLAGVVLEKLVESKLRSPLLIACTTAGWAIVMWIADRRAAPAPTRVGDPLGASRSAGPHGRLRSGPGGQARRAGMRSPRTVGLRSGDGPFRSAGFDHRRRGQPDAPLAEPAQDGGC